MPPAARPLRGTKARAARQTAKQIKEAPAAMVEEDVEIVIEDLATSHTNAPINIILHGPSGHGKTMLAGGAANGDRRVVFLSTEVEGIASPRSVGSQAELIRCESWPHAVKVVTWAEMNLVHGDWLVIDSGTVMQEMYMRWILATENRINPARDLDIPAVQNHQKYQNGFKRWASRIIAMPANTIFITTSMTADDAEGEERIIPLLLGKKGEISDAISSQFSVGIYYAVARESRDMTGDVIRRALCQPRPPWWAKDRYSALGKTWDVEEGDYFAMARMIEAIENSLKKGEAGVTENTGAGRRMASRSVRSDGRVATQARRQASRSTPVRQQGRARGRS